MARILYFGRLSDAVAPKAYRLDLSIDPNQPRFSGRVEIDALLRQPGKIARSAERRRAKVRGAIGVLINLGYVTFSPRTGLVMTSKGASALERRRASYTRQAGRKNGRQALLPSRA